jgi:hypothetical protein
MFEYFKIRMLIRAMWPPLGERRPEVIDRLAAIGLPAVPQLIDAMKATPRTAQETLVKIGRPAVPARIEALRHRNWLIRVLRPAGQPRGLRP